jgi:hypothetical protein
MNRRKIDTYANLDRYDGPGRGRLTVGLTILEVADAIALTANEGLVLKELVPLLDAEGRFKALLQELTKDIERNSSAPITIPLTWSSHQTEDAYAVDVTFIAASLAAMIVPLNYGVYRLLANLTVIGEDLGHEKYAPYLRQAIEEGAFH